MDGSGVLHMPPDYVIEITCMQNASRLSGLSCGRRDYKYGGDRYANIVDCESVMRMLSLLSSDSSTCSLVSDRVSHRHRVIQPSICLIITSRLPFVRENLGACLHGAQPSDMHMRVAYAGAWALTSKVCRYLGR